MTTPGANGAGREDRLNEILAAYLEAAGSGPEPDRAAWLARHPEFRAELAEFFAARDEVDGLTRPFREETLARSGPPARPPASCGDYELLGELGHGGMATV